MGVVLVFLYIREKKRKKRKVRIKDGLEGLPTRWTFLAIHEEVVEKGMKVQCRRNNALGANLASGTAMGA